MRREAGVVEMVVGVEQFHAACSANARMETEVPGLLVAGEAVGGANGANRLSGNAITEALVFGRRAGESAAKRARGVRQAFGSADAREDAPLPRRDTQHTSQ